MNLYKRWLGIESPNRNPDYFELLGISRDEIRIEAIKSAAKQRLALLASVVPHTPSQIESLEKLKQRIKKAYKVLSDTKLRSAYIARLKTPREPTSSEPKTAPAVSIELNSPSDQPGNCLSDLVDAEPGTTTLTPSNRSRRVANRTSSTVPDEESISSSNVGTRLLPVAVSLIGLVSVIAVIWALTISTSRNIPETPVQFQKLAFEHIEHGNFEDAFSAFEKARTLSDVPIEIRNINLNLLSFYASNHDVRNVLETAHFVVKSERDFGKLRLFKNYLFPLLEEMDSGEQLTHWRNLSSNYLLGRRNAPIKLPLRNFKAVKLKPETISKIVSFFDDHESINRDAPFPSLILQEVHLRQRYDPIKAAHYSGNVAEREQGIEKVKALFDKANSLADTEDIQQARDVVANELEPAIKNLTGKGLHKFKAKPICQVLLDVGELHQKIQSPPQASWRVFNSALQTASQFAEDVEFTINVQKKLAEFEQRTGINSSVSTTKSNAAGDLPNNREPRIVQDSTRVGLPRTDKQEPVNQADSESEEERLVRLVAIQEKAERLQERYYQQSQFTNIPWKPDAGVEALEHWLRAENTVAFESLASDIENRLSERQFWFWKPATRRVFELYLERGKPESALDLLIRVMSYNYKMEQFEECETWLEELKLKNPEFRIPRRYAIKFETDNQLRQVAEKSGSSLKAFRLWHELGEHAQAIQCLRDLKSKLDTKPDSNKYMSLAESFVSISKHEEAVECAARSIENAKYAWQAMFWYLDLKEFCETHALPLPEFSPDLIQQIEKELKVFKQSGRTRGAKRLGL